MKRNVYTQQVSLDALDTLIDEFYIKNRAIPDYLLMNCTTFIHLSDASRKLPYSDIHEEKGKEGIISTYKGIYIAFTSILEDGEIECVKGD